jgi:hypothetical protein
VVRCAALPKVDIYKPRRVVDRGGGVGAYAWIKGVVPASQTSGQLYECALCVECTAVPTVLDDLLDDDDGAAAAPAVDDPMGSSIRRFAWVQCACKQPWNCAHAGFLLRVVELVCEAARVAKGAGAPRLARIAYQCWWLGLDAEVAGAHLRQARTTPCRLLDLSRFSLVLSGDDTAGTFRSYSGRPA